MRACEQLDIECPSKLFVSLKVLGKQSISTARYTNAIIPNSQIVDTKSLNISISVGIFLHFSARVLKDVAVQVEIVSIFSNFLSANNTPPPRPLFPVECFQN